MTVSSDVSEHMRRIGRKGGRIGGKRSLETMTPDARKERASRGMKARWLRWRLEKMGGTERIAICREYGFTGWWLGKIAVAEEIEKVVKAAIAVDDDETFNKFFEAVREKVAAA